MPDITVMNIDPKDPNTKKEHDAIEIDMDVQEFDENFSGIEQVEEVNQKLIAYLEKLIRKSYEYKEYIGYLKSELDITKCAIVPTLDIKDLDISLEFHHYPMTLYDICDTMIGERLSKRKDETEKISLFDVMEDVMKEHYDGTIGLVPLSKTFHEMAHSGSVKIAASNVYGNYQKFLEKHKDYMTPELIDKVYTAMSVTIEEAELYNDKVEKNVLNYKVTYNKAIDTEEDS